jgi:archaellum component FlaC
MKTLKLFVLVLIGTGITTAGLASNGIMEDIRQRYFHEAYDAYKEAVSYLDASNQNKAKESANKLRDEIEKLRTPIEETRRQVVNVLRLNSDLTSKWIKVLESFNPLNKNVKQLPEDIGFKDYKPLLSDIKSQFEHFGSELNSANESFEAFGKRLTANEKMLDDLNRLISADVSEAYKAALEKLNARNTKDGEAVVKKLHELTSRQVDELEHVMKEKSHDLSDQLEEYWQPASKAIQSFNFRVAAVEFKVGNGNFDSELNDMKAAYEKLQNELGTATVKTKDFVKRFQDVCDSCR